MAKSEYLKREEAAKKQLGTKGVKKRVKQLPSAARASLREMTGIDVSRKGVKIDPFGVAMALPIGKVLRAAKALRAAGNIARADALTSRVVAKAAGGSRAAARGQREQKVVAFMRPDYPGVFQGPVDSVRVGSKARGLSESVFPRAPKKGPMGQPDLGDLGAGRVGLPFNTPAQIRRANRARRATQAADRVYELEKRLNLPGTAPKRSFGTVNPEGYAALQKKPDFLGKGAFNVPIVDTRRMNPAQAKSALEKGVNQTATFKRGVPSKPKKVNKVTRRLLGGR